MLALEDDIDSCQYPLLKFALQLVVDGTDPDIIQSVVSTRILSDNKRGSEMVESFQESDGSISECFADTRQFLDFDDRSIQKFLREVDTPELALMLQGAERDVRKKILGNMSKRAAGLLVEDSREPGLDVNPESVRQTVTRLFEIVDRLKEAGEMASEER